MTSTSQYALMAGVAYESSRSPNNKFPIPDGWAIAPGTVTGQLPSGFEAVTFKNNTTGEIVISFAGTNDPADWATNFSLATGFNAQQLKEAAAYYLTVLTTVANSNPNAWITFTGHSLGGGLAALMSVFFDKGAVTFDHDTLIDPDAASARILASSADGNTTYNATTFIQDKDNPKLWKNPDGKITLAQGDTWQLQLSGGGLNLGETFTDGDYGIRRQNAPTSINPTNTIMGTEEGNALSGTSAGDLIDGQDGKDDISGADGNDTIYAGGGIDWVLAGAGDDRVDGGQGDNVLLGSAGQTFSIYYSCHIDLA